MGSTRDFIAASLADSMLPLFRRSMEDVIYETLDKRQVPNRTDFRELRDLVNGLRGQLQGATKGVKKLAEGNEDLEDQLDALSTRLDAMETKISTLSAQMDELTERLPDNASEMGGRLDDLSSRMAALTSRFQSIDAKAKKSTVRGEGVTETELENRLEALRGELVSQLAPAAEIEASVPAATEVDAETDPKVCKVPGCKESPRARGFCARHYQKWRRGTLEGFEPYRPA
jgi:predicted  nucleic acid-binding Zn-ribbon protein